MTVRNRLGYNDEQNIIRCGSVSIFPRALVSAGIDRLFCTFGVSYMIFSSYKFIFVFLPLALGLHALARRFFGIQGSKVWLIAASLVFYSQTNRWLFLLLAGTILFNHGCVLLLQRCKERSGGAKLVVAAALIENLGLLFYFKYSNFFLENVNRFAGTDFILKSIILPLGISFFTFQIVSYIVDVYRRDYAPGGLLDFSLYVTFFPQLIVGPIIRYDQMQPQLADESFGKCSREDAIEGIMLFCMGCVKKILLADPLITHAQSFYDSSAGADVVTAWAGVLAFTFAYYFDFSGYIDMALGLGRFFHVKLPQNFNSPYKAVDFADFWRRWNISVSLFFNDYIFKGIFKFGDRYVKLFLATMATFLVSGVWHGAGWHFIAWGIFNGVLVYIANVMTIRRISLPKGLGWAVTFFLCVLARVLFDSASMSQAWQVYGLMFSLDGNLLTLLFSYVSENLAVTLLMLASAGICFFLPNSNEIVDKLEPKPYHAVLCGAGFAATLFFMGAVSNFLYFQF